MKSIYEFNDKTGTNKKYTSPTEENRKYTRLLCNEMVNFNGNISDNLKIILETLNLELFRIKENTDCYAFVPKTFGQYCIFFNVSKDCVPFIISNTHSGQDSVDKLGYHLFLNNKYKCLIVNGFHPNIDKRPSPYQPKKQISNADHSPDPSMNDFIDQYVNHSFKGHGIYVLHGMKSDKEKKIWFISSTGKAVNYGQRNINFFMIIAWALDESSSIYTGQTNNNLSEFYKVCKDGTKKYLTGSPDSFFIFHVSPTSSVSSHIVNAGKITKEIGIDFGRVCHAEHAITTIGNRPHILSRVHKIALEWYSLWDNDIHKFEDVPKNIDLFDGWIRSKLIN